MTFHQEVCGSKVISCTSLDVDEVTNRSIILSDASGLPSTYLVYFSRRSLAFGGGRVFSQCSSRCSRLWLKLEQKLCQALGFLRPKASALEGGTADGLLSELTQLVQ